MHGLGDMQCYYEMWPPEAFSCQRFVITKLVFLEVEGEARALQVHSYESVNAGERHCIKVLKNNINNNYVK